MKVLIINGPNLNMLGIREPEIYGKTTYEDMCNFINIEAEKLGIEVDIMQNNIEGEIINYIHCAYNKYDAIVINPGAYTHYSLAIYDAIKSVNIKTIEVHLSNIHAREEYRTKSVTAPACVGIIGGFGIYGYVMALNYLCKA